MKLITAIIKPERLEAVQISLSQIDVYLMTVSEVRGCGRVRALLPLAQSRPRTPASCRTRT